jgi:hypothetical protein
VDVAAALLARARATGAASLAVIGTSKNAGKSVVVAALAEALGRTAAPYALCSIGRDGETVDALDSTSKPRFWLRPGAFVATAVSLVPRTPALEIVAVTGEQSALGPIAIARVRAPGYVELAGPPAASALRRIVRALGGLAPLVLVDGAVDRIAALRGGDDAIVVAVGAAGAQTLEHAVDDVAALVGRLALPPAAPGIARVAIAGALTLSRAAELARAGETRQVVVHDGTHVAFGGRAYLQLAARLTLRCEVALRPVACTVAPQGAERAFEPRAFARAVARRTGLAVYDVYAATVTSAA